MGETEPPRKACVSATVGLEMAGKGSSFFSVWVCLVLSLWPQKDLVHVVSFTFDLWGQVAPHVVHDTWQSPKGERSICSQVILLSEWNMFSYSLASPFWFLVSVDILDSHLIYV